MAAPSLADGTDFAWTSTSPEDDDGPSAHAVNPEEFKRAVQAEVCRLGGDIVVTEINGSGEYVRGTVLKTAR